MAGMITGREEMSWDYFYAPVLEPTHFIIWLKEVKQDSANAPGLFKSSKFLCLFKLLVRLSQLPVAHSGKCDTWGQV